MKICGTVKRPDRRIASSRSGVPCGASISAERDPFAGQQRHGAGAVAAAGLGVDFDVRHLFSLRPGRWLRRRLTATSGRAHGRPPARPPPVAPAASSTRVQAPQVAPEVITSSTSSTRRPAMRPIRLGRRANAPCTISARAAAPRSPSGTVARVRCSASGHRRHARQARERPGQQRGLVVAPRDQPAPVQRHRHNHLGFAQQRRPGARHQRRQRRGVFGAVAIFERQHDAA